MKHTFLAIKWWCWWGFCLCYLLILQVDDYPTLLFYPAEDKANPVIISWHIMYIYSYVCFSQFMEVIYYACRSSYLLNPAWRIWRHLSTNMWKLKITLRKMNYRKGHWLNILRIQVINKEIELVLPNRILSGKKPLPNQGNPTIHLGLICVSLVKLLL